VYLPDLYGEFSYSNIGIYPQKLVAKKLACGRQDIHYEFVNSKHSYMGMRKRKEMAGEMKSAGSQKLSATSLRKKEMRADGLPPRRVVTFKYSGSLRKRVNGG
jgi:hypothetical protein